MFIYVGTEIISMVFLVLDATFQVGLVVLYGLSLLHFKFLETNLPTLGPFGLSKVDLIMDRSSVYAYSLEGFIHS
jgi:hypothetical protein